MLRELTFIELIYDIFDEGCELIELGKNKVQQNERRTSEVQLPELAGWKKCSVEAMSRASESSALEPPKNIFGFGCPHL